MIHAATGRHEGLSPQERRFISKLREIPPGVVHEELLELLGDIVDYRGGLRCPDAQADGVPCFSAALDCDHCPYAAGVLTSLQGRLRPD